MDESLIYSLNNQLLSQNKLLPYCSWNNKVFKAYRGRIFSYERPFYERAVSDLDP